MMERIMIGRMMIAGLMVGTWLLHRQILLHADHSVVVVMMGEYGRYQHDDVDKKQ